MTISSPRSRTLQSSESKTHAHPSPHHDKGTAQETPSSTLPSASFSLQPGAEPVAGYRLVRFLGQGGFGVVWEAEAPGGVRVALKFIWLHDDRSDRELRALEVSRNLRHAHVLDIHFAVVRGNYLVVAMPLCDQSLEDRLRACQAEGQAGLPVHEVVRYMRELASAIDFLNKHVHALGDGRIGGIQHRDIKPRNVLLAGGSIRLADFGLAKALESSCEPHSGCMSPHYVAPEELCGRVSRFSDQYALAVTYYRLRVGRLPFEGSVGAVLEGHLHGEPDLSGLPDPERQVVARALSKQPHDRWPTCAEFVRRLEHAMGPVHGEDSTIAAAKDLSHKSELAGRLPRWYRQCLRLVAVVMGLVAMTGTLSIRMVPVAPPVQASRHSDHSGSSQRRGHHSPRRQAPNARPVPSSRRSKGPGRCEDLLAIQVAGHGQAAFRSIWDWPIGDEGPGFAISCHC